LIGGVFDGKGTIWYDARGKDINIYFKVDEQNLFASTMKERFLNRQVENKTLGKIRKLKYKGDNES